MRKFLRNYHTHTALCNHAKGEIRDYVDAAVERGLKTIGFSCHAPYPFELKGYNSWYRMTTEQHDKYATEILALKEEYKDKIEVLLGYEAEYYPALWNELLCELRRYPCDFIIQGQHFYNNEYDGNYAGDCVHDKRSVKGYARILCEGMKTGLYSYVAHPDLCNFLGSEEDYVKTMEPLLQTCLEMDIPVEINLLGIRGRRGYPKQYLWKRIGEIGCKVVFGSDAHSPEELLCTEDFEKACEMVEKYGLNYTDEIKLISPHDVK